MNKSACRTIEILKYIADMHEPVAFAQIQKALDLPKSSTFELLETLLETGAIEYADSTQKTYCIGTLMFSIGQAAINGDALYEVANRYLTVLSKELEETVYLCIEQGKMLLYLDKVEPKNMLRSTCAIGDKNVLYSTGLGKALLATHTKQYVKELYKGEVFIKKTPYTIDNIEDLLEDIKQIQERGFSIDDREGTEFVKCIAVPVRDFSGKVVAAISTAMLETKLPNERMAYVSDLVIKTALEISRKLGYLGTELYITQERWR